MASRSHSVCTPIEMRLVSPGSATVIEVALRYDTDDPYAVHLVFKARDGSEQVSWMLARQLLTAGLLVASGEGDVRVWPGQDEAGWLYLELRSPSGHALFEVPRTALVKFVLRTYDAVPPGR